jgi:hypothetical protein
MVTPEFVIDGINIDRKTTIKELMATKKYELIDKKDISVVSSSLNSVDFCNNTFFVDYIFNKNKLSAVYLIPIVTKTKKLNSDDEYVQIKINHCEKILKSYFDSLNYDNYSISINNQKEKDCISAYGGNIKILIK